jgi:hypothetical protein
MQLPTRGPEVSKPNVKIPASKTKVERAKSKEQSAKPEGESTEPQIANINPKGVHPQITQKLDLWTLIFNLPIKLHSHSLRHFSDGEYANESAKRTTA